jgi:hypothetical protein
MTNKIILEIRAGAGRLHQDFGEPRSRIFKKYL